MTVSELIKHLADMAGHAEVKLFAGGYTFDVVEVAAKPSFEVHLVGGPGPRDGVPNAVEYSTSPDGLEYAVVRCRHCGEKAMPMSAAYMDEGLCLKCYREKA